jgi:hypothetical protein
MGCMPRFTTKDQLVMAVLVALGALLACGAFALSDGDMQQRLFISHIKAMMWFSGWGLICAGIGILFKRFWLGLLIGFALAFALLCVLTALMGC